MLCWSCNCLPIVCSSLVGGFMLLLAIDTRSVHTFVHCFRTPMPAVITQITWEFLIISPLHRHSSARLEWVLQHSNNVYHSSIHSWVCLKLSFFRKTHKTIPLELHVESCQYLQNSDTFRDNTGLRNEKKKRWEGKVVGRPEACAAVHRLILGDQGEANNSSMCHIWSWNIP